MEELLKLLGLPATATEAEVRAAVARLSAFERSALEISGRTTHDEALGALRAQRDGHAKAGELATENATLRGKAEAHERAGLIEDAIRRGFSPAYRDPKSKHGEHAAALPLAQLRTYFELARPDAPADPLTQKGSDGAEVTLTEEELTIAKQMGNDPQELLAAKRARLAAKRA